MYLVAEEMAGAAQGPSTDRHRHGAVLLSAAAAGPAHYPGGQASHTAHTHPQHQNFLLESSRLCVEHLEETSYRSSRTAHGTPATVTEWTMSSAFWPRLDPEMVTRVPPSSSPDSGSIWRKHGRAAHCHHHRGDSWWFLKTADAMLQVSWGWETKESKINTGMVSRKKEIQILPRKDVLSGCCWSATATGSSSNRWTHWVDDGSRTRLLDLFTAGAWVQASGGVATAPHTAVALVSGVAAAAVRPAHGAVVQGHWRQKNRAVSRQRRVSVVTQPRLHGFI